MQRMQEVHELYVCKKRVIYRRVYEQSFYIKIVS